VREVQVSFAELIRVFENSSPYSEYYLDLGSGEIHFFSTMDFPEHVEVMRKMDENKERFVKLPKLTRGFSKQVIMDFICTVNDPYLKELLEKYLYHDKSNSKAWILICQYLEKSGDLKKAYAYSDSAFKYLWWEASIIQNREYLNTKLLVYPYNDSYDKAVANYKGKDYETAIPLLSGLIDKGVKLPKVFEYRAFCYYFTQQYLSSLQDIDHLFLSGTRQPNLLNLRGINLQKLGRQEEACSSFKEAMKAGDQEGAANFNRFCK